MTSKFKEKRNNILSESIFQQFTEKQKWTNLRLICTSERQNPFSKPPDSLTSAPAVGSAPDSRYRRVPSSPDEPPLLVQELRAIYLLEMTKCLTGRPYFWKGVVDIDLMICNATNISSWVSLTVSGQSSDCWIHAPPLGGGDHVTCGLTAHTGLSLGAEFFFQLS